MRRLEIIGEAVKKVPISVKKQYEGINWKEISGMRDVLIHEYFGVHFGIIWGTVKKDIPKLKQVIETILKDLDGKDRQLRIK